MPLRNVSPDRSRGAPTGNKHKGHRAAKHSKKCAAYRRADTRVKNRDRRMRRIMRGFREPHTIVTRDGLLHFEVVS